MSSYTFHITAGSGPRDDARARSTWLSGDISLETSDCKLQALEVADEFYSQLLLSIERAFDAAGQPEEMDSEECKNHI
jgi:hypothetical protein